MNGINWAALISGLITLGSAVSVASGHPVLGAVISNPNTATALTAVVSGISGLYSMFAPALLHSTTTGAVNSMGDVKVVKNTATSAPAVDKTLSGDTVPAAK